MAPRGQDDTARRAIDLDPEIARFVREMGAAWASHPDLAEATAAEARRIADAVRAPWTRGGPPMAACEERGIPTRHGAVRVRFHLPTDERPAPALIYLHGGGWTLFSLDTHDRVMRELAARSAVAVLGVDYALSPEVKYPVALEQVEDVVLHLAHHGGELGLDPARLAIGGDSAGGNLALACCLDLRDRGLGPPLRGQVLIYPVLDRVSSERARRELGGPGAMLGADEMERFWENYLADPRPEGQGPDPLVSPLRADLAGVPPVLLVVPQCDLLAEQSLALAPRLQAAGVPVDLRLYPGASHSFLEAVSISRLADRALGEAALWLHATLAGGAR